MADIDFFLLLEDGDFFLLEDGDKLVLYREPMGVAFTPCAIEITKKGVASCTLEFSGVARADLSHGGPAVATAARADVARVTMTRKGVAVADIDCAT